MSDHAGRQASPVSSRSGSTRVAAGILLSRIAGFARERAIGHFFGVSLVTDAFRAAMQIPNLLQNLLGEGVLSASFIPAYSRLLAEDREEEAGKVAGAVAGLLGVLVGVLALVGILLARPLALLITPGYEGLRYELTISLMRIVFPGTGLLVLSAWCLGVLNSHRRFFLSYVAPVLWNIAQIVVLVVAATRVVAPTSLDGLQDLATALAWGTVIGAALQFLVQLPGVLRVSRGLRLSLRRDLPGVRQTIRAFGPVVAGRGVVQLAAYVDLFLASLLAVGAVASLRYAQTLYILPISLFGMSVAAAELPELSRARPDDRDAVARRLDRGLARIAFYVVPSTVGFVVLGDLVVGALYRTGEFGANDERLVWLVLVGFSVGLLASTSGRLLQSALYAADEATIAARLAAVRVTIAGLLGAALMFPFDRLAVVDGVVRQASDLASSQGTLRLGALGLALASGVGAWVEFLMLRQALKIRLRRRVSIGGPWGRSVLAAAAPTAVVGLAIRIVADGMPRIPGALLAVTVTGAAYIAVTWRLGVPEADRLVGVLRRRLPGR